MNHSNGIDQPGNALEHADGIRIVQRLAESFQCVQVSYVILGLIGCIGDLAIEYSPLLRRRSMKLNGTRVSRRRSPE